MGNGEWVLILADQFPEHHFPGAQHSLHVRMTPPAAGAADAALSQRFEGCVAGGGRDLFDLAKRPPVADAPVDADPHAITGHG